MLKKKLLVLMATILMLAMIATGCGSGGNTSSGSTSSGTPDSGDKTAAKDSITVAIDKEPTTFDPQNCQDLTAMGIELNIYEGLILMDKDNNPLPCLAESWDISTDSLTYTFHLKKNVKFHNGETLTANDVKFTFDRAKKSSYAESAVSMVDKVEVVDDNTVTIKLKYSYAPFIMNLGSYYLLIVNQKAVNEGGQDYGQHPVGTGPYKFVKWDSGDKITLVRNDEYHKQPAPIRNAIFRIIPDSSTALVALQNKEIDVLIGAAAVGRATIKNDTNLKLYETPSAGYDFIAFNCRKSPFDNKLVRQAVSYAVNKQEMMQVATEGIGVVTDTILTEGMFGYNKDIKGYPFDANKAKELLAKAGYPKGFETTIITFDSYRKKICEVLQARLAEIGITTKIEILEFGTLLKRLESGDNEIFILGITHDVLDADSALYTEFHSKGSTNLSYYKNPNLDKILEDARKTTDKNTRIKLYNNALNIINDDAPQIPLYFKTSNIACNKDIKGAYARTVGIVYLYDFSW